MAGAGAGPASSGLEDMLVRGVAIRGSERRGSPSPSRASPTPELAEPRASPAQVGNFGSWFRVFTPGFAHTLFMCEDPEVTTTQIHVASFWDEEFDYTDSVRWQKRILCCTPALGPYAGKEQRFECDEHPDQVKWCGLSLSCERCGPGEEGRTRMVQSCLKLLLGQEGAQGCAAPEALARAALLPGAEGIARGLGWRDAGLKQAAGRVQGFLTGHIHVEVQSLAGAATVQFQLPENASCAELYHATAAAFFQAGHTQTQAGFVLSTRDGTALLDASPNVAMDHPALRSAPEGRQMLSDLRQIAQDATEPEDLPSVSVRVIVHDLSGALLAEMRLPGDSAAADCKAKLRKLLSRHEPDECMHLVTENGQHWEDAEILATLLGLGQAKTARLTLVWASAFQYIVVPLESEARVLAGRGVFRSPAELPAREPGVSRVGFPLKRGAGLDAGDRDRCRGAQKLRGVRAGHGIAGPADVRKLLEALPELDDDDAARPGAALHVFELGPDVVRMVANLTTDGNQVGGSYYQVVVPAQASSCLLRSFLAECLCHSFGTSSRLAIFGEKFEAVGFRDLQHYLRQWPDTKGFTLSQ